MSTCREMEIVYAEQEQVITILKANGDIDLAHRLQRCMTVRQQRHYGSGWPYSCRSSACIWCRRAMIRGWWYGMREWSATATTLSLAIIPTLSPAGLSDATKRLRRGLRDVRDRAARRWRQWRTVSFAGMIGGDGIAMILVSHEGVDRRELLDVLLRRWPSVVLKDLAQEELTWEMTAEDAADLGRHRRGIETLRVVVMAQRDRQSSVPQIIEPMPVVIG